MADALSLPFREQSEFLRRKINLPTDGWTDIHQHEHDYAFVVAGANRDAIVADFHQAVQKAIDEGLSIEQWRKDFDAIVERHGWDYKGGRNWRSRVIYETNLNSSYQAGRWQQLQAAKKLQPYWQYRHSDSVMHPRPHHVALNGLVLDADDPWWQTHFPPNGWGCQCRVFALSKRELAKLGKSGPDTAPEVVMETRTIGQRSAIGPRDVQVPQGIDPGFAYAPGVARLKSEIPPERPGGIEPDVVGSTQGHGLPNRKPLDEMPPLRPFPSDQLLPQGLSEEAYVRAFLEPMGATLETPAIVKDAIGERLVVGKELFTDVEGNWKVLKHERERYLPVLAQTLMDPDEIWVRLEWIERLQKSVVRRRYMARFDLDGKGTPGIVTFEWGSDGWTGVTVFKPGRVKYLDNQRIGVRLFQREAEK